MSVLNALLIFGAILLWILSMVSLTDLQGSGAAGNGLALSFGVFAAIGLWIALPILLCSLMENRRLASALSCSTTGNSPVQTEPI